MVGMMMTIMESYDSIVRVGQWSKWTEWEEINDEVEGQEVVVYLAS